MVARGSKLSSFLVLATGSHFNYVLLSLHDPIYKAESVCLCVSVSAIRACISCSVSIKLVVVAGGTEGQVLPGLTSPVLQLAESYPSISAFP